MTNFIGAIAKKAGGIRAYASTIAWLLGVQIIWGIIGIVALWVEPKTDFIQQCENGKTDQNTINICTSHIKETKGIATGLVVLVILLHAYQLHVVGGYANELEQQQLNRDIILGSKYELGHSEDSRPMIGPDTSYAYADAAHSYGHQRGPSYA
ncbi:hypothetical protein HWV62_43140 [Athelia sp. TMB]|nr:hypothetical protein HWV62_43140 [Athelia sp. TMB]